MTASDCCSVLDGWSFEVIPFQQIKFCFSKPRIVQTKKVFGFELDSISLVLCGVHSNLDGFHDLLNLFVRMKTYFRYHGISHAIGK